MAKRCIHDGQRFGELVIKSSYTTKTKGKWLHLVLCDCGEEKQVLGSSLLRGHTTSCGCRQKRISTTHGKYHSPEYKAWCAMLTRVRNPNQTGYKNYGGRGIDVCKEWTRFENFYSDMGDKPTPSHSLERIDNEAGYKKSNCIWADRSTQSVNQRIRKDNQTGCKGVYYRSDVGMYAASIQRKKTRTHLGLYSTLDDAIKARKCAELLRG